MILKYVIHQHKALKAGLHFDLRVEKDPGKRLDSWAMRKIPPTEIGVKRMVIKQPTHEHWWLNFSGKLQSGYGAGEFKIWDQGTIKVLSKKKLSRIYEFNGRKLKGPYALVRVELEKGIETWLFFKMKR
jgi:DNA ligase D-like protein (predicted 3'-phosphoesterase)